MKNEFAENMKRQMNSMKHIIEFGQGIEFIVSEHPRPFAGGMTFDFNDYQHEYDIFDVQKIATCPTPGSFVYLYQITDIDTAETSFIIVNNKKYYDENGYFDEIRYDKFLKADNTLDAYREFSIEIESEF
jgi:hypothetical protein